MTVDTRTTECDVCLESVLLSHIVIETCRPGYEFNEKHGVCADCVREAFGKLRGALEIAR